MIQTRYPDTINRIISFPNQKPAPLNEPFQKDTGLKMACDKKHKINCVKYSFFCNLCATLINDQKITQEPEVLHFFVHTTPRFPRPRVPALAWYCFAYVARFPWEYFPQIFAPDFRRTSYVCLIYSFVCPINSYQRRISYSFHLSFFMLWIKDESIHHPDS